MPVEPLPSKDVGMESRLRRIRRSSWFGPMIVAVCCCAATLLQLDPANWLPAWPEGPGITLDESFNVQMGAYLAEAVATLGVGVLDPFTWPEIFEVYNPDHPPLGRAWLGVFHALSVSSFAADFPLEPGVIQTVTVCARVGSAMALGLTVFVVGLFTSAGWGPRAGWVAALSLAFMPRVFGHAHLASLETVLNLMWVVAVLGTAHFWSVGNRVSGRTAVGTGVLFGLLLLTKMQAVLLPPLVLCWALWHWRLRALRPLLIWGATGACVFVLGWPWLWDDVPGKLVAYFGRTTNRVTLNCWYLGQKFIDQDVPWHYPAVMFLVTVPVGLLVLGSVGIFRTRRDWLTTPRVSLLVGAWLLPLLLFSTSVAVYDGERLFLIAYPMWAIFSGIGAEFLCVRLTQRGWRADVVLGVVMLTQSNGVIASAPVWLSYYNGLVGGLSGAERLGFEVSYWGDGVTRTFLEDVATAVPRGGRVAVVPVMHQFYIRDLQHQSPMLRAKQIRLVPMEWHDHETEFLLSFARKADLPIEAELSKAGWQRVLSHRHEGIELATLWNRTPQ